MKNRLVRISGLTVLTISSLASARVAHAQAQVYTNPTSGSRRYALLNGDLLALYINDRGDMGSPIRYPGGTKSPGAVDPITGQPLAINNDGSVASGSYATLFSNNNAPTPGTLAESVRQKSEYITAGLGTVVEGFAVIGNDPGLRNTFGGVKWLHGEDLTVDQSQTFNDATQTSRTGPLTATSTLVRNTGTGNQKPLQIKQNVLFQADGAGRNDVKITLTFTNTSDHTLTGVRYARAVDPNQGAFSSSGVSTARTSQTFGTAADPNAFAINSRFSDTAQVRQLGFGIRDGADAVGTTLFSTGQLSENSILSTPDAFALTNNHVTLGAGKSATFTRINGGIATVFTTTDYTDPINHPFLDINGIATTVDFNSSGSTNDLALLSPILPDILPGASDTFTFFYFFNPHQEGPGGDVPEPGALALLVGCGISGGLLLRRRSKK